MRDYIVTYAQMIRADSPENAARAAFDNLQEPLDLGPILTVQAATPDGSPADEDEITIDLETLA